MKKIISICALTALSFTLIGCTSTSTTNNTPTTKQENTKNTIQLNLQTLPTLRCLEQQVILVPNLKQITRK